MKVVITVEREFEMDVQRILGNPDFAPPAADAPNEDKRKWLRESFYELCGFDRDEDHIDGSYVKNTDEIGGIEFDWPMELRG